MLHAVTSLSLQGLGHPAPLTLVYWLVLLLTDAAAAKPAASARSGGEAGGSDGAYLTCKPQGLLTLSQPYPRPSLTHGQLPVCSQGLRRDQQSTQQQGVRKPAKKKAKDGEPGHDSGEGGLSAACVEQTWLMACRICDPQVGAGVKPRVCAGLCSAWHAACVEDYFTFDSRGFELQPCPADGPGTGAAPCSRLGDLAQNGDSMCALAGLEVGSSDTDGGCYDGSDPSLDPGLCSATTSTGTAHGRSTGANTPSRTGRTAKSGQEPASFTESLMGGLRVVVFSLFGLWLVPRVMRVWDRLRGYVLRMAGQGGQGGQTWRAGGQGRRLGGAGDAGIGGTLAASGGGVRAVRQQQRR